MACPVAKVFLVPFLMSILSCFSSSPFSHPRAEVRLERLAQRARSGAGELRSAETYRNVPTAQRNSPNLWEAPLFNSPLVKGAVSKAPPF